MRNSSGSGGGRQPSGQQFMIRAYATTRNCREPRSRDGVSSPVPPMACSQENRHCNRARPGRRPISPCWIQARMSATTLPVIVHGIDKHHVQRFIGIPMRRDRRRQVSLHSRGNWPDRRSRQTPPKTLRACQSMPRSVEGVRSRQGEFSCRCSLLQRPRTDTRSADPRSDFDNVRAVGGFPHRPADRCLESRTTPESRQRGNAS